MIEIYDNPLPGEWSPLLARAELDNVSVVDDRVRAIVDRVRLGGDAALRELTLEIDRIDTHTLKVTPDEIHAAAHLVSDELKQAIEVAYDNIHKFHKAQTFSPISIETMPGVVCEQRAVGISSVGLYIPAGSAPLFSTVLMLAIPARVAGCLRVVLCTPPDKSGGVAPEILYTASLCGVDTIYKVGGAQAIAAMAYGTETISKVDKIFGPGNRYVTAAKQQLGATVVAIDMPAGPSEVMIMADSSAEASFVAADMLSQAEHGADSQAIVVCRSIDFARMVEASLAEQLSYLSRRVATDGALANSRIVVLDNEDSMIDFANAYAAEHLIISMHEPWSVAARITAAGSVFIGNYTPESAGDYASGTNHTLPTSSWARSMSGVNLDSFTRKITYQHITRQALCKLGPVITTMAMGEGLDAHAAAVNIRLR